MPRKRHLAAVFIAAWLAVGTWHVNKPLPPGTHVRGAAVNVDARSLDFLADITYLDASGMRRSEQEIFDAAFQLIDTAHSFIVADFFLLNDDMGATTSVQRTLSDELATRLLARKAANPSLRVLLVTDPVNEIYGGTHSQLFDRLRRGGIDVVITDLKPLRDSNPAYSALWRLLLQWWGNAADAGAMPNPFGSEPKHITVRSWLALLNFKANHRKLLVADRADGTVGAVITSANPHDASSAHSNVGLRLGGAVAVQMAQQELAVARFSGWRGELPLPAPRAASGSDAAVSFLTEAAIAEQLLSALDSTASGDGVQLAMFYLSDRRIVEALLRAARRGVTVQLILDPNKDAFGRQKDGVPNRPVAHELVSESDGSIQVRWYRTTGEQFHSKLILIRRQQRLIASLGSANLTRRNVGDYNLEANVAVELPLEAALAREMRAYFERLWSNTDGQYTLPFSAFADDSRLRYLRYRLMEATGLSTF